VALRKLALASRYQLIGNRTTIPESTLASARGTRMEESAGERALGLRRPDQRMPAIIIEIRPLMPRRLAGRSPKGLLEALVAPPPPDVIASCSPSPPFLSSPRRQHNYLLATRHRPVIYKHAVPPPRAICGYLHHLPCRPVLHLALWPVHACTWDAV